MLRSSAPSTNSTHRSTHGSNKLNSPQKLDTFTPSVSTQAGLARLLAEEFSDRLLMLGRGVADRLRLAAERRHLLGAELERLVEDGLAERERDARSLAQLARPGLRRRE